MNLDTEYYQEYRHASSRIGQGCFADILSQHSLVMVDAALPNLSKQHYIQLGGRLSDVQTDWVNLLCAGLNSINGRITDNDKQYRKVVSTVIKRFTNKLLEMLIEDKFIPRHELVGDADTFHSMLSGKAEASLQETSRLFHSYVDCLSVLYQTKTERQHQRASIQCFNIAYALGAWLDATTFANAK
jgi:hypothetical protein